MNTLRQVRKTAYSMTRGMLCVAVCGICLATAHSRAEDFTLLWATLDAGGAQLATDGAYTLSDTLGQVDASPDVALGGGFELTGGFWATPPCWCMSDLNDDGLRDGRDVQAFVDCVLAGGGTCACADTDTNGVLDMSDVAGFVTDLLSGWACGGN